MASNSDSFDLGSDRGEWGAPQKRVAGSKIMGDIMPAGSQLSRRALLAGTAASLAVPLMSRRSRAQSQPSEAAWRDLNDKMIKSGGGIRPNDPRFFRLTLPENPRHYNPPAPPGNGPPHPPPPLRGGGAATPGGG